MSTERPIADQAKRYTTWYILAAILFIVLGVFAIVEPAVAGLGVALLVGWLLVFGGVLHFISTFDGGGTRRVIGQLLAGIVLVLGGIYLLMNPLLTLGSLTLMLAAVILLAGVAEIIFYFRARAEFASGWILFNGILALILGLMIAAGWPSSSAWAIGTLVGVYLVFTGIARLMVGVAGRRLVKRVTG
ncbi:MAG TPA: HdeD family acid-resistance protein [Steroidobacteraceae bacterium]|nr:HdeD family acid-resistance protein [Steroidobacteraceae bacterium]